MHALAFFDAKPYDGQWFDAFKEELEIRYFEVKLSAHTAPLAAGCRAVCCFVNDDVGEDTLRALKQIGVELIALRCAGYNHVAIGAAQKLGLRVVRVPAYSAHAVAEHALALLLTLNRKTHKAYNRTRDFNFSLNGLTGFDLYGKVMGVIGTGLIGRAFARIALGLGMRVIGYDPYPNSELGIEYLPLDELLRQSDVISLHCPLTADTRHMIDARAFSLIKKGAILINTSRGELIESRALLTALEQGHLGGAALDVYEEEAGLFFEDNSSRLIHDDVLSLLVTKPNVIVTSHQAFLTHEALQAIAQQTLENVQNFYNGKALNNEVLP